MKFFEKIKDRYNILIIILFIMMAALVLKMAIMTIVEGDEYREISDTKRLKEIYTTAPRGEIRDRNGVLLAASNPTFTAQVLKDEIKAIKKPEDKNKILLDLLRLLEEDGSAYKDEYPIEFHTFKYKTEADYDVEELSPSDKIVETIVNNNLLRELLDTYYVSEEYPEHFKYITINKAISALEYKGIKVPIKAEITDIGLDIKFDMTQDVAGWKKEHEMHPDAGVKDTVVFLIGNDKTIIRKMLDNSIGRKLAFDLLNSKGLTSNIELDDVVFTYDNDYRQQKRNLMKEFDFITFDSSAKEDFVNIMISTNSINKLLMMVEETKEGKIIVPGQILIDMIEEKDLKSPVKIKVNEKEKTVAYENVNKKENRKPIEVLKEYAIENKLMNSFLISKDNGVGGYAQAAMLDEGYNPRITVADWEYTALANKYDLLERYEKQGLKKESTPEQALEALTESFKIDPKLSKYEIRGILSLYDQLDKQGHRAYEPINIAYGIKPDTVAKIEEGFMGIPSVKISIEPVRYYPKGEHAAHILGYLGKISQDSEIEKYVKEQKYSRNDIIGKTGLEESMESELRGTNGTKRVEVDVLGNTTKVLSEDKVVPGNNIYLTIDSKVQEAAEKALKHGLTQLQVGGSFKSEYGNYVFGRNKKKGRPFKNATSGSVVAVNVKTGELIALANYPAYDPNLFSTGISSSDWNSLFPDDERDQLAPRPLYNIGLQTAVQPGSTFKMITGLTALEKGLSPEKTIYDNGFIKIGDTDFRCLIWTNSKGSHGNVNIYDALKVSCNYYFYKLAVGGSGVKISIEDIADTAIKLGMNDKSGLEINIPTEVSGTVPDPAKKIQTDKILFRRYLENNLEKYVLEGESKTKDQINKDIQTIISWMDLDETMSKSQVVKGLAELGYNGELPVEGSRDDFGDNIKYNYLNLTGWTLANTLNVTIGQGHNAYTPIQMANAVATMVNGGKLNKITTINKITNFDNSKVISERKHEFTETGFDVANLDAIKEGMRRVSSTGTARRAFENFPIETGSKTGTAERSGTNPVTGEKYDDYSWFVSYGPYDDPEIAVAVVIFQGGGGGNSAPIAREVMAEYFKLNKTDEEKEGSEVELED